MILTGKALSDFNKWVFDKYGIKYTELCSKLHLNALIIEWFDSVRYTIDRNSYCTEMVIIDWNTEEQKQYVIDCDELEPFKEWYDAAIEKTNEIYNQEN